MTSSIGVKALMKTLSIFSRMTFQNLQILESMERKTTSMTQVTGLLTHQVTLVELLKTCLMSLMTSVKMLVMQFNMPLAKLKNLMF